MSTTATKTVTVTARDRYEDAIETASREYEEAIENARRQDDWDIADNLRWIANQRFERATAAAKRALAEAGNK